MKRLIPILVALCIAQSVAPVFAKDTSEVLKSPDGSITVTVRPSGLLTYSVQVDGKPVVGDSRVGLQLGGGVSLGANCELVKADRSKANTTWANPLGKRSKVRDQHNELRLVLREAQGPEFEVVFRAFNDGVGFRYVLPKQTGLESFVVERDLTEFAFGESYPCWAGQQDGYKGSQEYEFKKMQLGDIKPTALVGVPFLVQTPSAFVAIAESDLRDWAGLWLGKMDTTNALGKFTLTAKLAPRLDGAGLVKAATPHNSPWTVLMIGRTPGRLVESDLINNLSTPCQLADASWVKPGMMAWDHWWSGDVKMDTATLKDYIQLAADMGWPYQLIDWQWYGEFEKPTASILKVNPAVDMDEVRRFAKEKNVRLWVWLHSSDVDRNGGEYKQAFAKYEQWGIAGVKIDFMDRDDQDMVNWYETITKAAADHHLMVNFHGAFKPSGFSRTYPNQITREGILGNEYNKWSNRVTPEHKLTLPFTRFLSGPGDFTPGGFLNRQPSQFKFQNPATVQGTRAMELALFVCYDSPLCCACDAPEHYRNQPGADFLKLVPTVWDDTRVLDAEVGQHLVMARRSGKGWFLGGMTDTTARTIQVKLDFLGSGKWKVHLWKDAADAGTNAEHLDTEDKLVTAKDTLTVPMAPSGGIVARFQK